MRVWIIALLSLVAAVAAAAVLALPGLRGATPPDIVPILLPLSPALAIVALAGYALGVLLLTTGTLVSDLIGLRVRLAQLADAGVPAHDDIAAAFAPSRLVGLASRFATAPGIAAPDAAAWTTEFVRPGEVRSEIARLHYIWLARGQFFTALVLLAAIAAVGFLQDYAAPPIPQPGVIPTLWAFLALGGLVLLATLSRLVIDVTVEPVVEEILRLPGEQPESRLLRRMTELVEAAGAAAPVYAAGRVEAAPALRPVTDELLERLAMAVEESRRAWLDAVADLSAAAAALRATMGASAEALEDSLHAALERLASAAPSRADAGTLDAANFAELQAAVERLTMAIERLGTPSETSASEAAPTEGAPRRGGAVDRVADELGRLLREINAKP
jgi:hypothetical protein